MYRVTLRQGWNGDETTIQSPWDNKAKLISPVVHKDIDNIETFTFTIYPNSAAYNELHYFTSFIRVVNVISGKALFNGRVLYPNESMDKDGVLKKDVTCEGLIAFLHDSTQDYGKYEQLTPFQYLAKLMAKHNSQVEPYKQFKLGKCDVTGSGNENKIRYTEDDKDTWDTIKDKLVSRLGGELQVREEPDGLYLDYLKQIGQKGTQVIQLAENLLSVTTAVDPTKLMSVVKPVGATIEQPAGTTIETSADAVAVAQPRYTIASVNNGSVYLRDEKLIAAIGLQVKPVVFDTIKDPKVLLSRGKDYLANGETATIQYQITAVDLSMINKQIDDFDLGWIYHVSNRLMAIDEDLRIIQMTVNLNDPSQSTLSIGDKIIGQEEFEKKRRNQDRQLAAIQDMQQVQVTQIGELSDAAKATSESLGELQTNYDKLIAAVGDADYKTMLAQLIALQNQTATVMTNLGEIGAEVLANQSAITDLKDADEEIRDRLTALEEPTGETE
jgi:hypothetical protein